MAINCDLDVNLKALEDAKSGLKSQLTNLITGGSGGLGDIFAAADAQVNALLDSLPELPEIPNFQKEIDNLISSVLANPTEDITAALLEIEKKWGDAIPDIDKILADFYNDDFIQAIGNFDICGQIPNVDGITLEGGGFAGKTLPPTSSVPTRNGPPGKLPQVRPKKATEVDIDVAVKANDSDITKIQVHAAGLALDDKVTEMVKTLEKNVKFLNKEIKTLKKSKAIKQAEKNVPKEFKDRYNNLAHPYEYYILEAPTIPKEYDKFVEYNVRRNAFNDMRTRIINMVSYIFKVVAYPNLMKYENAWNGTGWNKTDGDSEELISKWVYNNAGFGLGVNKPDYGLKLKNHAQTQDAKQYIKNSFVLKPNNYTAAFEPKFQNITSMKNNTYIYEDFDYSFLLWNTIQAIFDVEVEGKNAMKIKAAFEQGVNYSDVSIPTADFFIPKLIGGKLKNYEDYIASNVDPRQQGTSVAAYTKTSFKPHYMYKKQGTEVRTVFASTYQEHFDLAQLGYVHNIPT